MAGIERAPGHVPRRSDRRLGWVLKREGHAPCINVTMNNEGDGGTKPSSSAGSVEDNKHACAAGVPMRCHVEPVAGGEVATIVHEPFPGPHGASTAFA